jgi:HTH-type transcriptional regulator / antitoxin HigA
MRDDQSFQPDWLSPPGETISHFLDETKESIPEFSQRLGRSEDFVRSLLRGGQAIDRTLATVLARLVGATAAFWLKREQHFRSDIARLGQKLDPKECAHWLRELPVRDMVELGWVAGAQDPVERTVHCLKFFGVSSIDAWRRKAEQISTSASLRTSPTFESSSGSLVAWLRSGELRSSSIRCAQWSAKALRERLLDIRALSRKKHLAGFMPQLQEECARCGVAVVVVPAPARCRASGATRVLSDKRRLIVLSLRHKTNDHFWFTLFHEIGHLLLHQSVPTFVDEEGTEASEAEIEANEFASDVLVPSNRKEEMLHLAADATEVMSFARSIGIAPGVVVGQLQHHGKLTFNQLNGLKRRFDFLE